MPVISSFNGIIVRMFFNEHLPPHFHVEHQGDEASIDFDGNLVTGSLRSARARADVAKWAQLNRDQLEENWRRSSVGVPLERIAPLR